MPKPNKETYPEYFARYINQVPQNDLAAAFEAQQPDINIFFEQIPALKHEYAYAPGKWTIKEMLQHIIDTERIFAFRALCFARGEQQNIPGFEENDYAAASHANERSWQSLCDELKTVRRGTQFLFESFSEADFDKSGSANGKSVTVLALGFMTIGHLYHHIGVLKERYLA